MEVQVLLFPQKRGDDLAAGPGAPIPPSVHSFYQWQYSYEQNRETGGKHSVLNHTQSGLENAG